MNTVAVITPYCREPVETIEECVKSVASQTVDCRHYLIADLPSMVFNDLWQVHKHIAIGGPHWDYGGTPRGLGALLAVSEGADAICFLDADNSFDPDHVEVCLNAARSKPYVDYVAARRRIVLPDGTLVNCQDEPIEQHVDTSCYFFLPGSFHALPRWALQPREVTILGDRLFLAGLRGLRYAATDRPTVTYTSSWRVHYELAGVTPPSYAKPNADWQPLVEWWRALTVQERTAYRRRLALSDFDL